MAILHVMKGLLRPRCLYGARVIEGKMGHRKIGTDMGKMRHWIENIV